MTVAVQRMSRTPRNSAGLLPLPRMRPRMKKTKPSRATMTATALIVFRRSEFMFEKVMMKNTTVDTIGMSSRITASVFLFMLCLFR